MRTRPTVPRALALACSVLLPTVSCAGASSAPKPVVSATALFRTCPHPKLDQLDVSPTTDPVVHAAARRVSTAEEVWESCEQTTDLGNRIVTLLNRCAQSPLRQFAPGNCTVDIAVASETGLPAACHANDLRGVIVTMAPECIGFQTLNEPAQGTEEGGHQHDVSEVLLLDCHLNMTSLKGPVDQLDLYEAPANAGGPVGDVRACIKELGGNATIATSLTTSVRW